MAQTIAVRAGGTGHAWTQANTSTLFTQSGGTATRVIINQLQFTCDTNSGPATVGIFLESAGSGTMSMIGGLKLAYYSLMSFQAWPGGNQQAQTAYPGYGTQQGVSSGLSIGHSTNAPIGGIQPSSLQVYTPYNSNDFIFFPSSFYMAAGDSVKVRGWWGGGTGACYYSFTTITES
jgi:hypothetical protein